MIDQALQEDELLSEGAFSFAYTFALTRIAFNYILFIFNYILVVGMLYKKNLVKTQKIENMLLQNLFQLILV